MQVIGSGFGRTGTTSLKAALQILGFGPCYHMQEVFLRPSHIRAWGRWRPGEAVDLDRLLGPFGSAVDFPACLVYEDLLERFPDAKVVHTVRDADAWYDSTAATIYQARRVFRSAPLRFVPLLRSLYEMLDAVIWDGVFAGEFEDRAHAIDVYERWTDHVVATVPPERLLVFDVADGWEPLCDFLGVPVPQRPFPRANDKQVFRRRLLAVRFASTIAPAAVALGLLARWRSARTTAATGAPGPPGSGHAGGCG